MLALTRDRDHGVTLPGRGNQGNPRQPVWGATALTPVQRDSRDFHEDMRVFHCDHCQQLVFFENSHCVNCGHTLAFLSDLQVVGSLEGGQNGVWRSPLSGADSGGYRLCTNYAQAICNWAIPVTSSDSLCLSCQLTRVIPNLSRPGYKEAWYKLEVAKRRLLYNLLRLGCPVESKLKAPETGLAFEFLSDDDQPGAAPVLTGHASGVITLNITEADDVERERRRTLLHEPYRTILGHFRHESGHYYWDRLVKNTPRLQEFRALFGDESPDYTQALQNYYNQGPPVDWQQRYVTAYASSHPWEDWAETWAHYLHMVDTLETAATCGLSMMPKRPNEPVLEAHSLLARLDRVPFQQLIDNWFPLTYLLNNLNRGLGLPDAYPFVLSNQVIAKLSFIHRVILQ